MVNIHKYINNQNWNIGFALLTPKQLLISKKLPKVNWLKHPFKDRFFADPFILRVSDESIDLFVEEYLFKENSKGCIVKLTIDRKNFKLLERKEILKLETHLSYPIIEQEGHKIFIYPENSESGQWKKYIYNESAESLELQGMIINQPLTDATFFNTSKDKYIFSTLAPKSQQDTYLFKLDSKTHEFKLLSSAPIIKGKEKSRMGGNFFLVDGKIYRPAQDCSKGYGKALTIFEIKTIEPKFSEEKILRINPVSWKYNLGIHTINFDTPSGICVIDSYGYLYPILGRILMYTYKLKRLIGL